MREDSYREVPTTTVFSSESDENMPPGFTVIRILVWMFIKAINVLYLPTYITRIFRTSRTCPSCPPIQDRILLLSATELADQIRSKKLSCTNVIEVFISRIKEINPIINAVIEDRFEAALNDAKNVDQFISETTLSLEEIKRRHPLLGVPITIKGSIEVAGMKSTSGMITRANISAENDAVSVKYARQAGAIPILTSNLPELCMNWESNNRLVGSTKNPYDNTRTAGGSSGGEACLLATAGSVIGIGSDVAGSLRLPAHFCGIFGHKPTPGTVSLVGHYPSCKNQEAWRSVFTLGPMARYTIDLKLLLQVILEPEVKSVLKLDEPVNLRECRIFFMESIDSPITNKVNNEGLEALHDVIQHFNVLCHNSCEKVQLPLMNYATELATLKLFDMNGVDNLFEGRGDGAFAELFRYFTFRSKFALMSILYGLVRKLLDHLPKLTMDGTTEKIEELKSEFIRLLGNRGVFLLPTFPAAAHHHGHIFRKISDTGYLSIFNVLGLPVTNCPVKFTKNKLPVGIQVVGTPYNDRLTLAVAEEIEKAFGGWKAPTLFE